MKRSKLLQSYELQKRSLVLWREIRQWSACVGELKWNLNTFKLISNWNSVIFWLKFSKKEFPNWVIFSIDLCITRLWPLHKSNYWKIMLHIIRTSRIIFFRQSISRQWRMWCSTLARERWFRWILWRCVDHIHS